MIYKLLIKVSLTCKNSINNVAVVPGHHLDVGTISGTISGTTRAPFFYKIHEPITSFMKNVYPAPPVSMWVYRPLIRFKEFYENRSQITIPSFIIYISPLIFLYFTRFARFGVHPALNASDIAFVSLSIVSDRVRSYFLKFF